MSPEPNELVERLRRPDEAAMSELEGLVRRVVGATLRRQLFGEAVDADALSAEVLEILWQKCSAGRLPIDDDARLPAYVRGVVVRCIKSSLRAERRLRQRFEGIEPDTIAAGTRSGLMVADEVFRAFDITRCGSIDWSSLSKTEYHVLRARSEGRTFREIHESSGLALATIHKTYQRAMTRLRHQLRGETDQ